MELIVFDLDGTLLNAQAEVSAYTRETLQLLAAKGIAYTVATGRTLHSAQFVLKGHNFTLPHIYNNGVVIFDPQSQTLAMENLLTLRESKHVVGAALAHDIAPFVSTIQRNQQQTLFYAPIKHEPERKIFDLFSSRDDLVLAPLSELNHEHCITNINVIGEAEAIDAIEAELSSEAHLVAYSGPAFQGDNIRWMDINHSKASKGSAVSLLREQLGAKKVICFGDGDNDVSLFAAADECYAPANAKAHLKDAATAIIGHHDEDGIAHFLRQRFDLS
jgi:Cof subfamily protein (haloacid dehalogenase superfamily)